MTKKSKELKRYAYYRSLVPKGPGKVVCLDWAGPFPASEEGYIGYLVVKDVYDGFEVIE